MSLDPVSTWQAGWATIPLVADQTWKDNLAAYIFGLTTLKLGLDTYLPPAGVVFTFDSSKFTAELADSDSQTAVQDIATGFGEAVGSSTAFVVAPGTSIGVVTPPTTFLTVTSALVDAPSILLAQTKILELLTAPPVSDPLLSEFPVKLREAFLLLTVTVIGFDSTPPVAGPLPLTDPLRAVE